MVAFLHKARSYTQNGISLLMCSPRIWNSADCCMSYKDCISFISLIFCFRASVVRGYNQYLVFVTKRNQMKRNFKLMLVSGKVFLMFYFLATLKRQADKKIKVEKTPPTWHHPPAKKKQPTTHHKCLLPLKLPQQLHKSSQWLQTSPERIALCCFAKGFFFLCPVCFAALKDFGFNQSWICSFA